MSFPNWENLDVQGSFALLVGRTIVRRTDNRQDVPLDGTGIGFDEFEAIQFDDGSWLVIEYDVGGDWGSDTWGSSGYCRIRFRPPPPVI